MFHRYVYTIHDHKDDSIIMIFKSARAAVEWLDLHHWGLKNQLISDGIKRLKDGLVVRSNGIDGNGPYAKKYRLFT